MGFQIVCNRVGTDLWANTRLRILKRIIKARDKTILDLGCGKGYVGMSFSNCNTVIFADIDEESMKGIKGMKVVLDASHIPFKQGSFDYVICVDVLEHIKDDRRVLGNIYSILKKGGEAIIALPAYSKLYGHHDKLIHHYRRYDKKTFAETVKSLAFKVKSMRYSCSLLFFPWLFNQLFVKSNNVYTGKSKIERKLMPLLNFIAWLESSLMLPFGINLLAILKK